MFAADFFFTFDDQLDLQRQLTILSKPGLNTFDMGQHLAFIVRCSTRVEIAIPFVGFEGRADPFIQWIGGLNVVVPIDQSYRRAWYRR